MRRAAALPHFLHPEEAIYASLRDDLKAFNIAPCQAALKSLSQTVRAKNKDAYARARAALDERLAAAETAVRAKETRGLYFTLETALEVLQRAADEYEEAVEENRIANVVEYQDARGFVLEADRLVGTVMQEANAKDAEAAKKGEPRRPEGRVPRRDASQAAGEGCGRVSERRRQVRASARKLPVTLTVREGLSHLRRVAPVLMIATLAGGAAEKPAPSMSINSGRFSRVPATRPSLPTTRQRPKR
ncbi:hypothetical protein [Microvirga makkahensis]|uniref:Uncharacterized protein n=1 Tax=Microvirga makkahensis TaxID=1128670 RepID=A0A7X3MNL0_9HYPH|nr:hypothetical protein [Microvirga makkahensis]MXQ10283.1 hypothetical protein [Microvirga makkahensis]